MDYKIFLSHSTLDANIGERFADILFKIGVNREHLFFSSFYHTGIKAGDDFQETILRNLREASVVIFLLSDNFYQSIYCLNEMGAAWAFGSKVIPILLGKIEFSDMKGVINSRYQAIKLAENKLQFLVNTLVEYNSAMKVEDVNTLALEFVKYVEENLHVQTSDDLFENEITSIETAIAKNLLTNDEIIVINFFIEAQTNKIYVANPDLQNFLNVYRKRYQLISWDNAVDTLVQSAFLEYIVNFNGDFIGVSMNIDIFRKLRAMDQHIRDKINNTLSQTQFAHNSQNHENFESIIFDSEITEIELLLYAFMYKKMQYSLGDRWMAPSTIKQIQEWENEENINSKLSSNYSEALRRIIARGFVQVESSTSYGNPREYKLKEKYLGELVDLSAAAQSKLNEIVTNISIDDNLPF